jgi:hypothetical protein
MNIQNVLLLVATLLCPAVSSAVCPIEHSTVFYINGVGVDRDDTNKSRLRLEKVLYLDPRATPNCVAVKSAYSYSANETIPYAGIALDLVESLIQKAAETGRSVTDATRSLLRLDDATWIDDILQTTAVLASGATYLIDDQITEHLAAYQTEAQTSGTLILAGHSQGNYFANEEWGMLSATAKLRVHLVAVATPATSQADGGPYVTVDRDFWAAAIFAPFGAPSFNVQNVEPCVGDILDWWFCHGWKESYMNGTNSRNLIVADIIALLPAATPSGTIEGFTFIAGCGGEKIVSPNIAVQAVRESDGQLVAETISDSLGFYHMILPTGTYFIGFGGLVTIIPEQTIQHDVSIPIAC